MNSQEILDTFANLRSIASQFRDALDSMGRVLEAAVHDLKDRDEAIRVQQERITGLEEDNRRLQERLAQTENDLWAARREARTAREQYDARNIDLDVMTKERDELKAEGVKLRDIILNVGALTDAILNAKTASEVASVNPTHSTPVAGDTAGTGATSSPSSSEPSSDPGYYPRDVRGNW